MKSSTWLLNRKLYFHKNAEPISSVKTKKAAKDILFDELPLLFCMKSQLQKSPAFKMNLSLCESCGPRPSATG